MKADVALNNYVCFELIMAELITIAKLQFVLIGFPPTVASHPERSTLNHGYSHVSALDRPACFVTATGIPDPLM